MYQDLSVEPAVHQQEDWAQCLPGFQLTHTLHLVSVLSMDVVSRVTAHLHEQQASVGHLVVSRSGDVLAQTIVLDDMTERRAKDLREQLLTLDGVLRIRLEHRFVRRNAGNDVRHARQADRPQSVARA